MEFDIEKIIESYLIGRELRFCPIGVRGVRFFSVDVDSSFLRAGGSCPKCGGTGFSDG